MDNPTLTRLTRGGSVESEHRGAWVVTDHEGRVLDGAGDPTQMIFARSSSKSLQALPVIESGAADHFGFSEAEIALAVSSHSGEPEHVEAVTAVLARMGLDLGALECGPARPWFSALDAPTSPAQHCCSGKHIGFLAVAMHLAGIPDGYLDPDSEGQRLAAASVTDMTGCADLEMATDGCSAPTFRLPLQALATGIARMASPEGLERERSAACERICAAAAAHPTLIAGSAGRLCTDLLVASGGRCFAKMGAEGVYVVGVRGSGEALAAKVDDGSERGLEQLVLTVLAARGHLEKSEMDQLSSWHDPILRNAAGLPVGSVEVVGAS